MSSQGCFNLSFMIFMIAATLSAASWMRSAIFFDSLGLVLLAGGHIVMGRERK